MIEYRLVSGFQKYRLGNDGTIWSCKSGEWKQLKGHHRRYTIVKLSGGFYRLHRLMLETFIGPCPDGMECRHLDGNSANNRLENLAWGTHSENTYDSIQHGTRYKVKAKGEQNPFAKLTNESVHQMRALSKTMSKKELTAMFNVSRTVVRDILSRKAWSHI